MPMTSLVPVSELARKKSLGPPPATPSNPEIQHSPAPCGEKKPLPRHRFERILTAHAERLRAKPP